MSRQTNAVLKSAAQVIKDETTAGANSATRVGTHLENQADSFTNKIPVVSRKTANYTLALIDLDNIIEMNLAIANTVTVPNDAAVAFENGTVIMIAQVGAGTTSILADTDVVIHPTDTLDLPSQYSSIALRKLAANEWLLIGNTSVNFTYAYGSIYRLEASGDVTQSIPTGATPTKVTAFDTNGGAMRVTPDAANDKITITTPGVYEITLSLSYGSGSAGINWTASLYAGGVEIPEMHTTGFTVNANDKRSTAIVGQARISSVPADIDYRVNHEDAGSVNLIIRYVSITVKRIGD